MSKRRKIEYHELDTPRPEEFPMDPSVASATELTGLMYRTPVSGTEWENLQQLSPMEIPEAEGEMNRTVADRLHQADTPEEAGQAVRAAAGAHSPQNPQD